MSPLSLDEFAHGRADGGTLQMVCRCGFATCFVCRKEIGPEGYAHFCQHFRAVSFSFPCVFSVSSSAHRSPSSQSRAFRSSGRTQEESLTLISFLL
jgi:hypothetical protein